MNKKILALVLCGAMLSGCATVQKKFTRKKPEKRKAAAVFLQEGDYQKQYTNDYYYKTHYTQWGTWTDELLLQFGGNRKKMRRCAEESLGHLTEMNRYLQEPKQKELEPFLVDLKRIEKKIDDNTYSESDESMMKADLEKIKRMVASNFYYDKVKDSVLPDRVDLGQ